MAHFNTENFIATSKKTYKTIQINPGHVSEKSVMSQFSTISFLSLARTHPNKQLKITNFFLPMVGGLKHPTSSNEYLSCVKLGNTY